MHERAGGSDPGDPRNRGDASGGGPSGVPPSELAGLGLALGLTIAVFALGGNWLDDRLGTSPLFVLLGVFLGFGGGFWSMYSRLVLARRNDEDPDDGTP
jgi:hypothetical protein